MPDALHRERICVQAQNVSRVSIDGCSYLNVSSNDVLGLSQHPKIIRAMCDAANAWGVGAGASPLVTGYRTPHQACEERLARWYGCEAALFFSSGFAANLGVMSALFGSDDVVMVDRACHASIIDGLKMSGARIQRYRRERLSESVTDEKVSAWVTDGVFSMSGELAPLDRLQALAEKDHAYLIVDEAHALGVCGPAGQGSLAHHGIKPDEKTVVVCPMGKAVGGAGAVVCASAVVIDRLVQRARSYMYSTALPAPVAAANAMALGVMAEEPDHHARLMRNKDLFESLVEAARLPIKKSVSAIYQWVLGDPERALQAASLCQSHGVLAVPMRPPTVPKGRSSLRMVLSALMTEADVKQLVTVIARVAEACCCEG